MVSIGLQRTLDGSLGRPAHGAGGGAQRLIDRMKTSGLASGTCEAARSMLGGVSRLGRPATAVIVASLIMIGCGQAGPSAPEHLADVCAGFGGMMVPSNPNAAPIDPRFPAVLNPAIEGMTEAERDALAPAWAEQAEWMQERQEEMAERLEEQGAPGQPPEGFILDPEELAERQLDFFQEGTNQPDATLDEMYAAAQDCQRVQLDGALTRFRVENPGATMGDLLEHNWEQMRRMFDENQGQGMGWA